MSSFPVEGSQSEFGSGALYFNGDAVGNFVNGEVSSLLDLVNVDFNTEETAPPEPITGLSSTAVTDALPFLSQNVVEKFHRK